MLANGLRIHIFAIDINHLNGLTLFINMRDVINLHNSFINPNGIHEINLQSYH